MCVMHVGQMRMAMLYRGVMMCMHMRLARRVVGAVDMLMVLVVAMRMGVRHRHVKMLVLVSLGEMEPHP